MNPSPSSTGPGAEVTTAQASAAIAHEMNTRLAVILAESELALMEENLPPGAADYLRKIQETATDAGLLTANLLRVAGRNPVQMIPTRLNDLLRSISPALQESAGSRSPLHLHLSDPLPLCDLDPAEIREMLRQLCQNAAEASPPDKPIVIRTEAEKSGGCLLTIEDAGSGLPSDFQQSPQPPYRTLKPNRLGIGLAVAAQIIRQHGASWSCEAAPGKGTRIEILFPPITP